MNLFGYAWVAFSLAIGWLVWGGTHNLFRSIFAGAAIPPIVLILFGAIVGRAEFEAMLSGSSQSWVFLGMAAVLAALIFFFRNTDKQ